MIAVKSGYNPTIDYLRVIAALLIVQIHMSGPLSFLNESAVAFFVLSMVWFSMLGVIKPKVGFFRSAISRASRLMYPFLVWGLLAVLAKLAEHYPNMEYFQYDLMYWLPPLGVFGQLWFLPWATVVSLVLMTFMWEKDLNIEKRSHQVIATLACGAISTLILHVIQQYRMPLIIMLSTMYIIPVLFGVLIVSLRRDPAALVAVAVFSLAFGIILIPLGLNSALQFAVSTPLMIAALFIRMPETSWASRMGPWSMDIYLSHTLLTAALTRILPLNTHTWADSIIMTLVIAAIALLIQMGWWSKWLR